MTAVQTEIDAGVLAAAEERDKWLDDVRSYAKIDKLVEIQQYTYVLKGEKIEYFGPENEK